MVDVNRKIVAAFRRTSWKNPVRGWTYFAGHELRAMPFGATEALAATAQRLCDEAVAATWDSLFDGLADILGVEPDDLDGDGDDLSLALDAFRALKHRAEVAERLVGRLRWGTMIEVNEAEIDGKNYSTVGHSGLWMPMSRDELALWKSFDQDER